MCTANRKKESKKNDLRSSNEKKNLNVLIHIYKKRKPKKKMLNSRMLLFVREKMVKNSVIDILLTQFIVLQKNAFVAETLCCQHSLLSTMSKRTHKKSEMVKWPIKFKY